MTTDKLPPLSPEERAELVELAHPSIARLHYKTLSTAIPRYETTLAEMEAQVSAARQEALESSVLAYGWMIAHDKLKIGLPYDFPKPADTPESISRAETAEARIAALEAENARLRANQVQDGHVVIARDDIVTCNTDIATGNGNFVMCARKYIRTPGKA